MALGFKDHDPFRGSGLTAAGTVPDFHRVPFLSFGKWTQIFGHSALIVKSAFFSDYLKYTDKNDPSDVQYSVYNVINSRQYLADASFRKYAARWLSFDAGSSMQVIHARLQSYGREIN